jgi:hypothetical protein
MIGTWESGGRMERFARPGITVVMATFLKIAARVSAIGTLAVAALIFGWQAGSWILTDEWRSFPISRALSLAGLEREVIYATASASEHSYSFGFQTISDWFLDLPAGGFLLVVAAVLFSFSVFAASQEKQFD